MVDSKAKQPDRWALQSTASATMRPVQSGSALAVPRLWTMGLDRLGFTYTQTSDDIQANNTRDRLTWLESTVLRLSQGGGVDRVLPMLDAVATYRQSGVADGDNLGHCIKFMLLMYRASTSQARSAAQHSLLSDWQLLAQRGDPSPSQTRARALFEEIVLHVESQLDAPPSASNWTRLHEELQFRYGAVWMEDALRTLRENAGTASFGAIAQRYLLKLIETSTQLRPSSGGIRP
jgi:hypothetical protein